MKNKPPRTPAGSFSSCLVLIKNVFSLLRLRTFECVWNLKCVFNKTVGKRKHQVLPAMCSVCTFINVCPDWHSLSCLCLFRSMLNILNGVGTVFVYTLHEPAIAMFLTHRDSGPLPGRNVLLLIFTLFSLFLLLFCCSNITILLLFGA